MLLPQLIEVDGPIVPILGNWNGNVVFSVQLTTGMVVTNPEQFPNPIPTEQSQDKVSLGSEPQPPLPLQE